MLKNYSILIIIVISIWNCSTSTEQSKETKAVETPTNTPMNYTSFGDKITPEDALSFEEVMTQLENKDSIAVKMTGTVNAVCQAKGCWMNISSEKMATKEMFVKFKDYGFFVPKDCSGKTAIMGGYAFREVTSIDELRHYAEDEGKSKEEIAAITEPVEELKFMASGVLLADKGE